MDWPPADQIGKRLHLARHSARHDQGEFESHERCDRHEIRDRIVIQLREDERIERHHRGRRHENGVAVGCAGLCALDRNPSARARDVLDDRCNPEIRAKLI